MAQRSKLLDFESCLDKLFQSALADLSDDLIEYIRLHPSANELHFTLGLYLRNKFIYPEEAYGAFDPDSLSDEIVHELIKRCIPEFKDYKLVYDQLESEPLYSAYRYCLKVKGTFPLEEFTKHYNLLLKAKEISEANPYSLFDDDHYGKRLARANRAQDEREPLKSSPSTTTCFSRQKKSARQTPIHYSTTIITVSASRGPTGPRMSANGTHRRLCTRFGTSPQFLRTLESKLRQHVKKFA